jgi:TRAP-type C4-dicarboxylate transport system substrate-binding protein
MPRSVDRRAARRGVRVSGWCGAFAALGIAGLPAPALAQSAAPSGATPASASTSLGAPIRLRVVGGLGSVSQYTRHEQPFWTRELARLSGGRATAEIVSFDGAGIRGQEMLRLVQLGVVPFGTSILNLSAVEEAELGIPDLAGLNPDMAALRKSVAAYRPRLKQLLHDRYGSELLAIYAYQAQVTFCTKPLSGLADLSGRKVRISSPTQSDWVSALGAVPVQTTFTEIPANLKSGKIDCAITGAMAGNGLGLHEVATHLQTTPVNWGLAAFIANGAAWASLPKDVQELLQRELPKLEQAIWNDAEAETRDGIACNTGAPSCTNGRPGRMLEVLPTAADAVKAREIFAHQVLPAWLKRCGPACAPVWTQTMSPATGVALRDKP